MVIASGKSIAIEEALLSGVLAEYLLTVVLGASIIQ
jgi:hypothetical protein